MALKPIIEETIEEDHNKPSMMEGNEEPNEENETPAMNPPSNLVTFNKAADIDKR